MASTPDPILLAFDASGPWVAVALGDQRVFAPMDRGQAEELMPLLEGVLAQADLTWRDLDGIAVGTGPGNFTGVRAAVAAARGLALGLGVPAFGISAFETVRDLGASGLELITLPAPRGQVQGQRFADGRATEAPTIFDPADLPPMPGVVRVRGAEAHRIAAALGVPQAQAHTPGPDLPDRLARVAAHRWATNDLGPRPAPLYVRPPDAAPPAMAPPALIG